MAKSYSIKAKEFFSKKTIELEIITDNAGQVLYVLPTAEYRKKLIATEETVTLPKRIWDKIPYAFKYWDSEHNLEPPKEAQEEHLHG